MVCQAPIGWSKYTTNSGTRSRGWERLVEPKSSLTKVVLFFPNYPKHDLMYRSEVNLKKSQDLTSFLFSLTTISCICKKLFHFANNKNFRLCSKTVRSAAKNQELFGISRIKSFHILGLKNRFFFFLKNCIT